MAEKKNSITASGHRDRVKQQFISQGLDGFYEHHCLELLLFYSIPQKDTKSLARDLINHFGTLSKVFTADIEDLIKVKGISYHTAVLITLILPLNQKILESSINDDNSIDLDAPATTAKLLISKFTHETQEVLYMACLDNRLKIVFLEKIAEGSENHVNLPIKKIVKIALDKNANNVILAHNHPLGFAIPSHCDCQATSKLYCILKDMSIDLLDHIVVANSGHCSMAEAGFINQIADMASATPKTSSMNITYYNPDLLDHIIDEKSSFEDMYYQLGENYIDFED